MSARTKTIIYITGIILLFALIFLIWAFDTGRLGIHADVANQGVTDATQLTSIPSPDQSTFAKIFTFFASPFSK